MSSDVNTVLKEALEEASSREAVEVQSRSANIRLLSKDYEETYRLANAIVETRSYATEAGTSVATHKAIAAQALMDTIEEARENRVGVLYFLEEDLLVLADNE